MYNNMLHIKKGELEYFQFSHLLKYSNKVSHCFTTRKGGISRDKFTSMNLGVNNGDPEENVLENYRRICAELGSDYKKIVLSSQVHEDLIWIVKKEDAGKGLIYDSDIKGYDGLITNVTGISLITFHADCVPIFLYDPVKNAAGVVHSGWRGTVKRIAGKAIQKMNTEYGTKPKDLIAGIGPSIGRCCFEVDSPVIEEFRNSYKELDLDKYFDVKGMGKWHIELSGIIAETLEEEGILKENIVQGNICTKCRPDLFFSHRFHGSERGTLGAIIHLKPLKEETNLC